MHKTGPLVSIIIATYNRSNILKYTISTVLKQNYQHFEILVIGDHCTDDTESVINSFDDKRISFYNLEENFGEQSYPNNFGFQKSKGELIAWLNHDDLWYPEHLDTLIKTLVNTLLFVVGLLSVVMIIFAGILYTTSAGDASKVTRAKNTLTYSIVGLLLAFLAFAIVNWVLKLF